MSNIFERSAGVAGMRDYLLGLQTRIMGALQAIEADHVQPLVTSRQAK